MIATVDQIQHTFLVSDEYPTGICCLASVIKLYTNNYPNELLAQWKFKETVTLAEIRDVAMQWKFNTSINIMTTEQLKFIEFPAILFCRNELGKYDFAVYYGFDGKRFVVGEPAFGLMQYMEEEMGKMWAEGIGLEVMLVVECFALSKAESVFL